MRCEYACGSVEHGIARRQFLGGLAAGSAAGIVGGLGALAQPAAAKELTSAQKRVLVVFMSGGLSQLESWDPKPKTDTGGPFRAIPTSVPGTHICELLPLTAQHMHHLAIVRSVNIHTNDHGIGRYKMVHGRPRSAAADYPHLGAVTAKALERQNSSLPGHIRISPGGGGGRSNNASYLGPKYASIVLGNGNPPQDSTRPEGLSTEADVRRNDFRRKVNERFTARRRTAETDVYTYNFEQAQQLMRQREVFDVSKEAAADHERYGKHDFGKHCLLARRLLENEITFVQVSHSNYDTHNENFNFHLEQLGEFDRSFAALVGDLADRGMLESTLIVVMSEFGRTPRINARYGRDHWGKAWSVVMGGSGVQPGAVYGATNKNGTEVSDKEVDHANLFHTYLQAVGVDSTESFQIDGRDLPIADPASSAIDDLLV